MCAGPCKRNLSLDRTSGWAVAPVEPSACNVCGANALCTEPFVLYFFSVQGSQVYKTLVQGARLHLAGAPDHQSMVPLNHACFLLVDLAQGPVGPGSKLLVSIALLRALTAFLHLLFDRCFVVRHQERLPPLSCFAGHTRSRLVWRVAGKCNI